MPTPITTSTIFARPYTPATQSAISKIALKKLEKIIPMGEYLEYGIALNAALDNGHTGRLFGFSRYRPEFGRPSLIVSSKIDGISFFERHASNLRYRLDTPKEYVGRFGLHPRTLPLLEFNDRPRSQAEEHTTTNDCASPTMVAIHSDRAAVQWIPALVGFMSKNLDKSKAFSLVAKGHRVQLVESIVKDISAAKMSRLFWTHNPFLQDYLHRCADVFATAYPMFNDIITSTEAFTTKINDAAKVIAEATAERNRLIESMSKKIL